MFSFWRQKRRFRSGAGGGRDAGWQSPRVEGFSPLGRFADSVRTQAQERQIAYEESTQAEIRQVLSRIAVIAFVGASGTGKSTRALAVAKRYNIEYLIDDGLLIHGSNIIAGSSAKRAATKVDSVRQAIFLDDSRAATMRRALVEHRPTALMILGTSDEMLDRICKHLWLRPAKIFIRIEDVTSEEEREQAKQMRLTEGRHAIPVPSMEIKHEFSGYFSEPLMKLRRRFEPLLPVAPDTERTIVRPTFSTLGSYSMSEEALAMLIQIVVDKIDGVSALLAYKILMEPYGIVLNLDFSIRYGVNAQDVLRECQIEIAEHVERYTSINVLAVNVRASRVDQTRTKPFFKSDPLGSSG